MIDLILLVVIGVSALLGLLRGFIGIVVGTLSWLLAGWATFQFGGAAGFWLAKGAAPSMTQSLSGYVLMFVGVLVTVAAIGMVVRAGVQAVRLNGTDRMLGFALGAVRGAFFACVLALLGSFTPLTAEPAWRQSLVLPLLQPGVGWMRAQLPDWHVPDVNMDRLPQMELGKLPLAGDNAGIGDALSGSALQDTVKRALGRPAGQAQDGRGDPDRALPANIDPAQVRGGEADPARVESHGQARPPSQ
ncbi:MAG TPA: colicin V synthesis protein [Xanthomonadaceae bacterium]|nr:colicin V synthesis protein [Xanthomonadaceae bacterium]